VEDLELSEFKETNGEEDDIFLGKHDDVLCEAMDDTNKWFQSWEKASTSKDEVDEINDSDAESCDSDRFHSLDNEEDDDEWSPRQVKMRYPEWKPKWDLKDKVKLKVGLRFANPTQFKEALQVFPVQNSFDYKYLHNENKLVSAFCKKNCG
jgi:hypothetical protein